MTESSCATSFDLTWWSAKELQVMDESGQADNLDTAEDIDTINSLTSDQISGEIKLSTKNIVQDIRENLHIIGFVILLFLILKLMALILPDDIVKVIGGFIRAPFSRG